MHAPEPIRRFWRETISPRPIAAGSAAAVAAGLAVGAYLAAGAGFEPPPPMKPAPRGAVHRLESAPQPITFMKGADGKTPEWVIGTDNIPGRETWRDRLAVATVPDPEDEAEPPRGRGLGWLLPWRWGRSEPREAPPPERPNRRIGSYRENQAAAAAAERAERERDRRQRYADAQEAELAAMEEQRRARERFRPRYEPRYEPRYDPRAEEADIYEYEDEPPPPPGRWRSGR